VNFGRGDPEEAPLSEAEPIQFRPRLRAGTATTPFAHVRPSTTLFTRKELDTILNLYVRKVAAGEWRDYAIDFGRDKAVFAVFRNASEVPLYRIEKSPRAYSVVAASGRVLKRAHDLHTALAALDLGVRLCAP
jgi:hypothetical protein